MAENAEVGETLRALAAVRSTGTSTCETDRLPLKQIRGRHGGPVRKELVGMTMAERPSFLLALHLLPALSTRSSIADPSRRMRDGPGRLLAVLAVCRTSDPPATQSEVYKQSPDLSSISIPRPG
jgi:hypothetical protein